MNGGTCIDVVLDVLCDCPDGFHGKYCELGNHLAHASREWVNMLFVDRYVCSCAA